MPCKPTSEEEMWNKINDSWGRMTFAQRRLWDVMGINPVIWRQHSYGDHSEGFWVVAIAGKTVVWYDHIEGEFIRSKYVNYGEIAEGRYCPGTLENILECFLGDIQIGRPSV